MSTAIPRKDWHVSCTMRALELLASRPYSSLELADPLGVHPRTARRLLQRLAAEGYVAPRKLGRRHRYEPTTKAVALAGQIVQHMELTQTALGYVAALRLEVGESAHLTVPSYLHALCIVHDAGGRAVPVEPQLSELVPAYATAAGKALLASREQWSEAVIKEPLERYTPHTIVAKTTLRAEHELTRERGYAIERGEYRDGVSGVAASVFSHTGLAIAALGVVGPSTRLPQDRLTQVGQCVAEHAAALSQALGFDPSPEPHTLKSLNGNGSHRKGSSTHAEINGTASDGQGMDQNGGGARRNGREAGGASKQKMHARERAHG